MAENRPRILLRILKVVANPFPCSDYVIVDTRIRIVRVDCKMFHVKHIISLDVYLTRFEAYARLTSSETDIAQYSNGGEV